MIKAKMFKQRAVVIAGRALYAGAVEQARRPAFYLAGVPDTPEGRFELYTLHVVLVLHRLKREGAQAADVAQSTFDAFLRGLDDGLREMGVGDLSVGKKMRKLGEAVYGRVKSVDHALESLPDRGPLEALVGRTVLEGGDVRAAPALARYVVAAAQSLQEQALDDLIDGRLAFPEFTA